MYFLILTVIFVLQGQMHPIYAHDVLIDNEEQTKEESLYLGTHLVTGGCSFVGFFSSAILSLAIGDIAAKNNFATWLDRTFKITPNLRDDFLTEDFRLHFITHAVPAFIGVMTGLWVIYKTPQWTDTYIIKKTNKRTDKQNVITFLNRIFWTYPFGVIFGEIFNDALKPAALQESNENKI